LIYQIKVVLCLYQEQNAKPQQKRPRSLEKETRTSAKQQPKKQLEQEKQKEFQLQERSQ